MTAEHLRSETLLLEWLPYDAVRPQQALPAGSGLMCAGTRQVDFGIQSP